MRRGSAGSGRKSKAAASRPRGSSASSRQPPRETTSAYYDDAPVAYVSFDRSGIVRTLNRRATDLLGAAPLQVVGFPFRTFVVEADRTELLVHMVRFRADGRAVSELRLRGADGAEIAARLESLPAPEAPDRCWTSIIDISARKEAALERARLETVEKAARDANAVKDRFIAVLSHELRAPLAPLLAAVSGLEAGGGSSPAALAKFMDIIKRNVLREARLIDDLLDVSRIASGKVGLRRELTDLHAVARESLEMVAQEASARRHSLTLGLEAARHHVNADGSRLRQVFTNLLKNAVKFTPEGGNIAMRSWNNGGTVVVEVSDDGIGIAPRSLERIFESFEQVHGAAAGGGLGLGLAISRGMINLHGGTISGHSAGLGRGARFLVELPALPVQAARAGEHRAPPPRSPAKRAPRGLGVLVVEDEPDLAETLLSALESEGYRARAVGTANAALAVDLNEIGVVISDLGLPDLDGRTLLERLKSKRDLKAIALSGYGTEADVLASEAAGFDQHLTKPVELQVLLGAIDRVCAT